MNSHRHAVVSLALAALAFATQSARAGDPPKPFVEPPGTVSPEAAKYLKTLKGPAARPLAPAPDDLGGWKQLQDKREAEAKPRVEAFMNRYQPAVVERKINGVRVLDIQPKGWQ